MFPYGIAGLLIFFLQDSCQKVVQHPELLTVREGDFTIINCTFNHGTERLAASAEFYRMPDDRNPMNSSLDGRIIFTSTDSSLIMTIHNAIICDSGTYICKVKFYHGGPYKGNGSTLNVIESKRETCPASIYSAQAVVELTRIGLMVVLIVLTFILLCKFW